MELTKSYERVIPEVVRARYEFAETRNAAAVLAASNPEEFAQAVSVLAEFQLESLDITEPGGNKSRVAKRLDERFRVLGWREASHDTTITSSTKMQPYRPAGERAVRIVESRVDNQGYKIDNVKARIALDVEWNAKDGNLDRDVGAYRAFYDTGIIDGAILITRDHPSIRALSIRLGRAAGFNTQTTTNLGKLVPRLTRGDSGGCPVLAIAITDRCYKP